MGTPTSAGGAPNDVRDRAVRFITFDLWSSAFKILDPDFTEDADGRRMGFWTNLLRGARFDVAGDASAIIARTDDLADPLEEVALFKTDAFGQPRWCLDLLGTSDEQSYYGEREFTLTPGATYAALISTNADAVQAVWGDLKLRVASLGFDEGIYDEGAVEEVREIVATFVREPPFISFNSRARPDSPGGIPEHRRLPGAVWKLAHEPDQVDDKALVFMELMLRQAGVKLPSTMGEKLSASVFSSTFLRPLQDFFSTQLRDALSPSAGWDGDFILASRPAVGRLYLVELFVREMRRKRRNSLWCDLGLAGWRGAAFSMGFDAPNPTGEAEIGRAAAATFLTTDPLLRMFEVRRHCGWIRGLASKHVTATGLAISDDALDAAVVELEQRMSPDFGYETIEEKFGHDEVGLSPLFYLLLAEKEPLWSGASRSGHDCPTEVQWPPLRRVPGEDALVAASKAYFFYFLYGADFFFRAYAGSSYESVMDRDDVLRATAVKDLLSRLSDMLRGCYAVSMIREGFLRGDESSLFLRLVDARRNVGGAWATPPPTGSPAAQTSVLGVFNDAIKRGVSIVGMIKSIYSGAVEDEVWRLIRESGGPAKDPATLMSKANAYFGDIKTFMDMLGGATPTTKLTFSIGAKALIDATGTKITSTLIQKGGVARAPAVVDLYVLEKRGAVGAWPDLKAEDIESDVSEMAERIGARELVVPTAIEGFASVVGLTVTLMNFDRDLRTRVTTLGKIVVVGNVAQNVLSTTSSVFTATRLVLLALPESARGVIPLFSVGGKSVTFTELALGAGNVAKWVSKGADGVGAVVAVGELADTFIDPSSGLNKARRVGDPELTAAYYSKTGFLAVSAVTGLASVVGLASAPVTVPIGLACAFAIVIIDARISEMETDYHKLVARGTQQFEQNHAFRRANEQTGAEDVVSEATHGLYELLDAARSITVDEAR